MKKFTFKYESILDMRINAEDKIKNELGKKNHEKMLLLNEIEKMKISLEEYSKLVSIKLNKGCSASSLNSIQDGKDYYFDNIDQYEFKVKMLDRDIEEIKIRLIEAIKEKKIMEKLKEREKEKYVEEYSKEEDKITEEIVIFNNNKRGD